MYVIGTIGRINLVCLLFSQFLELFSGGSALRAKFRGFFSFINKSAYTAFEQFCHT
jgi:hypothetical protein